MEYSNIALRKPVKNENITISSSSPTHIHILSFVKIIFLKCIQLCAKNYLYFESGKFFRKEKELENSHIHNAYILIICIGKCIYKPTRYRE